MSKLDDLALKLDFDAELMRELADLNMPILKGMGFDSVENLENENQISEFLQAIRTKHKSSADFLEKLLRELGE